VHLKSLTLKGFKSFADTTSLELEPGVTVVVGPNGSGKSNIVDAVAWVLGAQGPKTVRSSKMEDVIFAGTANRPALGRAEVSLTIDNADGMLPIEFAEVTITRTLFRNGESEYALNGVPCRLLDVQDLLSDSGVGRQQHVIVGQGQLDTILNARPEDRRAVIEEAAGVLKFRKRKEKAERRLESTEGNLLRLSDLLREVRRQLRPLERQADAARRHGALVEELAAIRLFVAGRELNQLRQRLQTGADARHALATDESGLKSELARLDAAVLAAESELSAMGADDLGDDLVKVERLREQARGLSTLLAERRRGIERDRAMAVDQAVIATLEAEAARLRSEVAEADAEAERLVPDGERLAEAEAVLASERAEFESRWGDGVPLASGAAAEVRGELAALSSGVERGESEAERLRARLQGLTEKAERLAGEAQRLRQEIGAAESAVGPLGDEVGATEAARMAAETALAGADAALRAADADRHSWAARAEALASALDEARARAGAERLAGVDGVIGTLLDLVEVDEGWEAAFEAAVGPALGAVVVRGGADGARRALGLLAEAGSGAVLPLGIWAVASRRPDGSAHDPGLEPVRAHVRAQDAQVDAALDALLGDAVCVDGSWSAALEVAVAHPDAVVVTRAGDRFAGSGWRVGGASSGATGAALEDAQRRAATAAAAATAAETIADAARRALADARRSETDVARALAETRSLLSKGTDTLARVDNEGADATAEAEAIRAHLGELAERVELERARRAELQSQLPGLEAEEQSAAEAARSMQAARHRLDERAAAVGALRTDLEIRATGLDERRTYLQRRLVEVDERLSHNVAAREEAESRRVELDRKLLVTDRLSELVNGRLAWVEGHLAELRERRRRQSEAARATQERLDGLRRQRADAERRLSEVRERAQRAELDAQELKLRIEAATETLRRDLDCEPEVAMAAECPPLPEATTAPARLRELERELRLLGPINPLALEEFTALQERHTFIEAQLEDVKSSRRELARLIKAIDQEIVEVFVGAFADVSLHFTQLFETLFPGGQGRLRLTDPDNPLETGIEVDARPSGKNVRKLSLLSGGERSLTAMAFLFAVFRSRPSPFYLMDEVEAALDDVNLRRFLDLVDEFRQEAQLVIVSHQKRTMECADTLYGVTMEPGGSSRVVSERVATGA
jgi:chromosome segregation protein